MPVITAIAMILPMSLLHLFEVWTILYPAPMIALLTMLKAAGLALIALF
jgi:hypothetical protein